MPYKNPEDKKKRMIKWRKDNPNYDKEYYQKNKDKILAQKNKRRREIRSKIKEYKSKFKCANCGEDNPCVLDCHHNNPDDKEYTISNMVSRGFSFNKILKELEKCTIYCSNCHKKLHCDLREAL